MRVMRVVAFLAPSPTTRGGCHRGRRRGGEVGWRLELKSTPTQLKLLVRQKLMYCGVGVENELEWESGISSFCPKLRAKSDLADT